jgi:hypothetical protein
MPCGERNARLGDEGNVAGSSWPAALLFWTSNRIETRREKPPGGWCRGVLLRTPEHDDLSRYAMRLGGSRPSFCYDVRVNFGGEVMIMRHLRTRMKTMITKEQFDAIIKAVNEGGDDDDEITEDEVIAILRDTGLDTEIPYFQELFAWERSRNRPQ